MPRLVPGLCEAVRPIAWSQVQGEYTHLTGLKLEVPPGPIDLLIGMDHPGLLTLNEIRGSQVNEPYAT